MLHFIIALIFVKCYLYIYTRKYILYTYKLYNPKQNLINNNCIVL